MILPGNARQVIIDALAGFSEAPNITASKVINDLEDAGFRVVDYRELTNIIEKLIAVIKALDPAGKAELTDGIVLAKALIEVMKA
ncbi:hypothetical protein [Shinella zoogloeoides]|uniref:hypothetical protein n=1 Tax=Shinella zoogloeoides TaxID=352475 RepID=UPI00299F447A|nr:hypothetical protein [Shinella zoogloeoides]WPE19840.1 hypothetical protein ShzoTeo12_10160 [Shinella zoogloeoides]